MNEFVCTQVSQTWFGEAERIWSTAAMAGSGAVGGMIGSVMAPLVVGDNPANIPTLQTILTCIWNAHKNILTKTNNHSFNHSIITTIVRSIDRINIWLVMWP